MASWATGLVPGSTLGMCMTRLGFSLGIGSVLRFTFSNFSSTVACVSSLVAVFSSTSLSFSSFASSWAIQHIRDLCLSLPPGPPCILQVGLVHLRNLYIIPPSGVLTLTQHGKLFDLAVGALFLFLFHLNNSLKLGSGSFSMSSI